MCLIATEKNPKTAEKGVRCYKILDKNGDIYKTPWQRCLVTNEMLNGDEALEPMPGEVPNLGTRKSGGFIHSINGLGEAQRLLGTLQRLFSDLIKNPVIFECEIPEGAEYFEGFDNNYYSGFASNKLMFVKEIEA